MQFKIVDVFTENLFGGNPAGVVLIPENRDFPSAEIMRLIAEELRYSETAFIKKNGNREFTARYFTPASEVDLCGHATIGSIHSLVEWKIIDFGEIVTFETLAGNIDIEVNKNGILMDMASPSIFPGFSEKKDLEKLYNIMGIDLAMPNIRNGNKIVNLMPKIASTGLKDIMMPVKDFDELEKISPDFKRLSDLSKEKDVVGVHAFSISEDGREIHARNFAPLYDIDEEAATGTSNGALAYYLYEYNLIDDGETFTVIQGEKMGRPSKIKAAVKVENGKVQIKVGGKAVTLVDGDIKI